MHSRAVAHVIDATQVDGDKMTPLLDCRTDADWLTRALQTLHTLGFVAVSGVLQTTTLDRIREAMYRAQKVISAEVGQERLQRAGELGVLRLLCKYDQVFLDLLATSEILAVVDATVSPTAVLHLQNGFILPSFKPGEAPKVFQNRYHMDFPRVLNGYVMSINVMLAVDEFRPDNGATIVLPGSHQQVAPPQLEMLESTALPATCPPGSMLVFDSTLFHAAGPNTSGADRLAINHQFTRSYIKQQVDYVRALGDERVLAQVPRTQQLLGWYTRVISSLDEYYQPPEKRLYRSGQG
jgi:ectoine hydroxylase-related dioxygenase (phytanoyl-CoA dioxygenase family)